MKRAMKKSSLAEESRVLGIGEFSRSISGQAMWQLENKLKTHEIK